MMEHRLSRKDTFAREIPLEIITNLINTNPYERTKQDKRKLQIYFCHNAQYFKKLQQDGQLDKVNKLITYLKIENFKKNAHIMNFGEEGDKFYTLLSGKIGIYKPFPKEAESTFKEYVEYLVYVRDVEKNIKKFNRIQDYNSKIDKYRLLMINYDPSKITKTQNKIKVFIEEERKLIELGNGCSFGEMALIKNEPRNATIIALENCVTVTVDRTDYKKIMKELEEQRINSEMAKFKDMFPIFINWSNGGLSKLKSGLINEIYEKDDYIYKQNDIADYIYLLTEGEIEITCDVNFGNYESFIEYIYDNSKTLFNEFDNSYSWKEDNLHKIIEDANEKNSLPFDINLSKVEKYMLLHSSFVKMNNSNVKNNSLEDLNQIEKENEYNQKIIRRINIEKLKAPQFFGFLEILELKRRICNIKCISNTAKIQKFPYIEYLSILPRDKKSHFHLQKTIYSKKKYLIEQLRNGIMAKLDFHIPKNNKILGNYYPDRNRDKVVIIKPNILIKSISKFSIEKENKNKNRSMQNVFRIKNNNETKNDFKKSKDPMIINSKSNLIIGFKQTLFNKERKRNKSQTDLLSKNNTNVKNYSEDTISTGKFFLSSKIISEKVIPKILIRKTIRDFNPLSSSRSKIKNKIVSLPNIGNKVINNYFSKHKKDENRNKSSLSINSSGKKIFE